MLLQELEYGRPVSFGEVFRRTHTKPDGTFVDCKAKEVAEAYEKQLQEVQDDPDGPANSNNSSERSTQRSLTIDEKNEIFLKVFSSLFSVLNPYDCIPFTLSYCFIYMFRVL